jgi:ribonuclease P protein component
MAADAGAEGDRPRAGRSPRRRRLSRSAEFERVYREGSSHANRHLVLHSFPRPDAAEGPRLGISVGRKVGHAVDRNRMKRLLREAFWASAATLPAGHDFVLVARPDASELTERGEAAVEDALQSLLAEAGLLPGPEAA